MTSNHNPLAIIPARGGSKGIPHKNIKPLCGMPLILHTLRHAREAGIPDSHILLSTDDATIADVARGDGLEVWYMRPDVLGGDTVGSREVMLDAMDAADRRGLSYDSVLLLQPTSPLRQPDDIRQALALYHPGIDMVVSVRPSSANPYYDIYETDEEGSLHISKGDGRYTRRQDTPPVWQYNGAVYVINPASLRAMPMGAFPHRIPYVMPAERSIDLDTPLDWQIAENMMLNAQS